MPPLRHPSMVVAAILLAAVGLYHAQFLAVGSLHHPDEFHTLDRSASVLTRGDWTTIFSNNLPTFKKPPLQYWMSASLLRAGLSPEVATRLPSFLFAIGVLVLTGVLAYQVAPASPWAVPISIMLLASSKAFWISATSALLDMGAAFFVYLALVATLLALKQPRWWYLATAACVLGALQKVPLAALVAATQIVAASLAKPAGARPGGFDFRAAVVLTLLGMLAWPSIQFAEHGFGALDEAYWRQMVDRFAPLGRVTRSETVSFYRIVTDGEPLLRQLGGLAVLWLPWGTGRRELRAMPVLLIGFLLAMATATGFVSPRYSILLLPMLMAALATAIVTLIPTPLFQFLVAAFLSAAASGPLKSAKSLELTGSDLNSYVPLFQGVAARVRPQETLVACAREDTSGRASTGALAYYASGGKPFYRVRDPGDLARLAAGASGPYRGVCADAPLARLSPRLLNFEVVEKFGGFTHWRADGIKSK